MDNETKELNITTIAVFLLVLFFTYCAVPTHDTPKISHEKDDHAEEVAEAGHEEAAGHDQVSETGHGEAAAKEASSHAPAAPAKAEKAAADAADGFDLIAMNNPGYAKHKKGIVMFTHRTHFEDYGISCGDCHHDDTGTPLELAEGDDVQSCIECHEGTQKPKGEKLPKDEAIMKYHFEALHANCIGCHKAYNIEKGDPKGKKPAPVSCQKCHPKTKK